ncbi:MAG TPA: hypothetical protein DCQ31_19265 [Bacteroidales bacterium]|nr:hypothetical protein [Bacteroidales bacterium]
MKKMMFAIGFILSLSGFAQGTDSIKEKSDTHLQLYSQLPKNAEDLNRVSISVVDGIVRTFSRFSIPGLINVNSTFPGKEQMALLANINDMPFEGLQLAGFVNLNNELHKSTSISGLGNLTNLSADGALISGTFNYSGGSFDGMQLTGGINISNGSMKGVQLTGGINVATNYFEGSQISGGLNYSSGTFKGVQLSGFANFANNFEGTQLSPFYNQARNAKGFQLALINVADSMDGFPIGLLSIVKRNGYSTIEIGSTLNLYNSVKLKMGVKNFYNIYGVTMLYSPNGNMWGVGMGFGSRTDFNYRIGLEFDYVTWHISNLNDVALYYNQLQEFDVNLNFRLAKHFTIFAGGGLNIHSTNRTNSRLPNVSTDLKYSVVNKYMAVHMWPTVNFGIKI